ncbi:hypothetical protein [Salibacterium sp. K-3]
MRKETNQSKLIVDTFVQQGKWALWLLGTVVALYIAVTIFAAQGGTLAAFLTFSYEPGKLFMLVIAIFLPYSFLDKYIKLGITRKQFLTANGMTAVFLAAVLTAAAGILTSVQHAVMGLSSITETDTIAGLDVSIAAFLPICFLSLLTYHFIGWMIGAGFHRYGWLPGLGFIVLGIFLIAVSDLLWGFETIEPAALFLPREGGTMPNILSSTAAVLLLPLTFYLIWQITRKAAVRS